MSEDFSPSEVTFMPPAPEKGAAAYSAGTEFDGFRLEEKIGRGGLGEVWKARDLDGNRDVAIKFVPRDIQCFETEMERVRETFQTIHALQHSNICPVYVLRRHPELGSYLVMKFLEGVSLEFLLRRQLKLPLERVTEILRPVAQALDYAHRQQVVHRDVKPANIMLDFARNADGSLNFEILEDVQLIDFGLASEFRRSVARVSQIRMSTSGTRPYMSPEQFRGRLQNAFSDQYSLAVVAYELLAGHLPFETDDEQILRECVLNEAPEPVPGLESAVNEALLKGLAKERELRFPTCEAFVQALSGKPQTVNGMQTAGSQTMNGTQTAGSQTMNGTQTAGSQTMNGTQTVGSQTANGTQTVGSQTVNGNRMPEMDGRNSEAHRWEAQQRRHSEEIEVLKYPQQPEWKKKDKKEKKKGKSVLWDTVEDVLDDPMSQKVGRKLWEILRHILWNMKR